MLGGCPTCAATWAGAESQGLDVALGSMLVAGLNVVPTAWVALAIGAIGLGLIPRLGSTVVYTVVGSSLIIDLVGSLVSSLGWLTRLSLFHYVALAPAEDANWVALAVYTLTAAVLALIAVVTFDRRDLATE